LWNIPNLQLIFLSQTEINHVFFKMIKKNFDLLVYNLNIMFLPKFPCVFLWSELFPHLFLLLFPSEREFYFSLRSSITIWNLFGKTDVLVFLKRQALIEIILFSVEEWTEFGIGFFLGWKGFGETYLFEPPELIGLQSYQLKWFVVLFHIPEFKFKMKNIYLFKISMVKIFINNKRLKNFS